MKQKVAVPAVGAVAFTVLLSTLIARAQDQPYPPGTLLTVAGNGKDGFSGDGGPAIRAALSAPQDQAVDAAGNVYIADGDNHRIRKVSPDGTITTVTAKLTFPTGVAVGPAGDLFISDGGTAQVQKVSPGGIITTVAGGGHPADGVGDGGPATAARFHGFLHQVAVDAVGNLFIADGGVRRVDPAGIITTVAGGGKPADGRGDGGPATAASFQDAVGVAVDPIGNVYISDWMDGRIRKVDPAGTMALPRFWW
jgi:hypothetical protein